MVIAINQLVRTHSREIVMERVRCCVCGKLMLLGDRARHEAAKHGIEPQKRGRPPTKKVAVTDPAAAADPPVELVVEAAVRTEVELVVEDVITDAAYKATGSSAASVKRPKRAPPNRRELLARSLHVKSAAMPAWFKDLPDDIERIEGLPSPVGSAGEE